MSDNQIQDLINEFKGGDFVTNQLWDGNKVSVQLWGQLGDQLWGQLRDSDSVAIQLKKDLQND